MVNCFIKMIYFMLVKTIIDTARLAKVIIDIVMRHYGLPKLIIRDQSLLFISRL